MPFKSKSQQRFLFAAESRNDVPKGTAERWAKETPDIKKLPERVRKKSAAYEIGVELALTDTGLLKTAAAAAVSTSVVPGIQRLLGSAGKGLKDFFTAKRVRETLKDLGQTSEILVPRRTKDVLSALKPYGITAGLGGLAALTPGILRSVYPDLGDE